MRKLIVGNWKMNPESLDDAKEIFRKVQNTALKCPRVKTVICPPFVFLSSLGKMVRSGGVVLGAQDVFGEDRASSKGAHTEQRALGETDEDVSRKLKTVIGEGMTAILCIGERERDSEGAYVHFIQEEIKNSLAKVSKKELPRIIIAYEPIWAVGPLAEKADTPDGLFEMTILIRKTVGELFGQENARTVPILYGGSVTEENARAFLAHGHADGLLVGRASLHPDVFGRILEEADAVKTN